MPEPTNLIRAAKADPVTNESGVVKDDYGRREKPTPREQLILFAIGHRERYGLEIQRAIEECSNGFERISIGSLYPTLHSLEQKGLVESRFGDEVIEERCGARRRYYCLSRNGKTVLDNIITFQNKLLSWQNS